MDILLIIGAIAVFALLATLYGYMILKIMDSSTDTVWKIFWIIMTIQNPVWWMIWYFFFNPNKKAVS